MPHLIEIKKYHQLIQDMNTMYHEEIIGVIKYYSSKYSNFSITRLYVLIKEYESKGLSEINGMLIHNPSSTYDFDGSGKGWTLSSYESAKRLRIFFENHVLGKPLKKFDLGWTESQIETLYNELILGEYINRGTHQKNFEAIFNSTNQTLIEWSKSTVLLSFFINEIFHKTGNHWESARKMFADKKGNPIRNLRTDFNNRFKGQTPKGWSQLQQIIKKCKNGQ